MPNPQRFILIPHSGLKSCPDELVCLGCVQKSPDLKSNHPARQSTHPDVISSSPSSFTDDTLSWLRRIFTHATGVVFLKLVLFFYLRERGRGGEGEGEKHRCDREIPIAPQLGTEPAT